MAGFFLANQISAYFPVWSRCKPNSCDPALPLTACASWLCSDRESIVGGRLSNQEPAWLWPTGPVDGGCSCSCRWMFSSTDAPCGPCRPSSCWLEFVQHRIQYGGRSGTVAVERQPHKQQQQQKSSSGRSVGINAIIQQSLLYLQWMWTHDTFSHSQWKSAPTLMHVFVFSGTILYLLKDQWVDE